MSNPLFAILTASYNNAAYLDDWLSSVIAQKYRPLEVVFVNDCSTDRTSEKATEIAKLLAAHQINFKYIINEKRQFCSDAYKIASDNTKADFMGILDGDDKLAPGAVEHVMKLYQQNPSILYIYTQFQRFSVDFKKSRGLGFSSAPKHKQSLLGLGARRVHAFSHWRTFSRRNPKVMEKIWKKGLRGAVDKYMGYRLEELGLGLLTKRVCYYYRQSVPGCISKVEKSDQMWRIIMTEASRRRKKYRLKPYPIRVVN